jgi:hypothetical protein
MKRRYCLAWLAACASGAVLANPTPAESQRIDKLIAAVGKRTDIRFIRNGKEYSCEQAAEFLRGKLKWRLDKVTTVQDFIEQIGTRSTTSGESYQVRMAGGQTMPSAEFLQQELQRIDTR